MADELQDPAADEQEHEPDPALNRAESGDLLASPDQRAGDHEHGQRQRHVEHEVVGEHDRGEHHRGADGDVAQADLEADPRERNEEREHDRRHADEVRGLVAAILVIGRVDAHLVFDGFHGRPSVCMVDLRQSHYNSVF